MCPSPAAATGNNRRHDVDPRRASPVIRPEFRRGKRPANYGRTFKPAALERWEIDALFAAIDQRRKVEKRLEAMMTIWYRCGARLNESIEMMPGDVDLSRGIVHITHAKGDRPGRPRHRTVGLDDRGCEILADWIAVRAALGVGRDSPLFCKTFTPGRGAPVWGSKAREQVQLLAHRAGVDTRVAPHVFRHTHAFELRVAGWDFLDLQQQLGHRSLDHTARYIDHLAPTKRIAAARKRPWADPPELAALSPTDLALVLEYVRRSMGDDDALAA